MKVVATSDTHFPFDNSLIPDGDLFIHAGDLMYDGTPKEWEPLLDSLAALPHKLKVLVPGNHDYHIQNYMGVAKAQLRRVGVKLITEEEPVVDIRGVKIGGIPYVTGLPGWAFNRLDIIIEEFIDRNPELFKVDILVTHAPPYRILDVVPGVGSVGCLTYNKYFWNRGLEPKHWVFGHIHEGYGMSREYAESSTLFHNVAMCDRNYKHTNKAQEFDV